jgi:multidrug efflux pump subunit AcrB
MAVVASTATTVAAFAPMLFWPGIIGEFMGFMPKTLIITLSCSLFVALIINPVVTGYFARVEGADEVRGSVAPWARFVMVALGAMLLTALALVNPISAGVLAGFVAAMWLGYVLVLGPIGRGFVQTALPRVIEAYRGFLAWMLVRDYTARRAYLRNMFALVAFTVGVTFAMVGGLIGGTPGKVFLFPGGALAALGLVGILIHTLEGIFLGARGSVLAGVGLGAVMAALLGLMSLGGAYEEALAIQFMIAPVLLFVFGLLGWVLRPKSGRLILTDNRARLMNATLGGLFLIAGIYGAAPTGVEFFPETDPNQIQVVVEASLGTNLDASDRVAREVTRRVDALVGSDPNAQRAVENVLVNVGIGGDAMFGGGAAASPERSRLVMNLVDFEDRFEASRETMAKLREQLVGVPGAEIEFQRDEQGPPTGPPVNIEISGPDFGTIVGISRRLKAQLTEAHDTGRIPELVDIRDNLKEGRPEVAVRIDRERAARFGLDTQKIASTVRTAINGSKASTWRDGKDEFDITVRLAEGDRADLESLRRLDILHEGRTIPLVSVAEFVPGAGLGSITRKDQFRVVTVQANVTSGANAQAVLGAVQADLAESGFEETLPEGYNLKYTGENEDQQKSFAFLTTALGLGVALIFMIMIAQFNSVLLPFIIIVAVALSMTGVMLGLIVTRLPYSLFTFIGVISLAGIVVNNNIVLIDYIQQLRERGLSKRDAIIEGGATRLRPVALTALTTVLGLIPLTFGINIDFVGLFVSLAPDFRIGSANTQFWGPMGVAIISGLTFATFLTLVVVPVMYSLFDSTAERVAVAFGRAPKAPAGPAEEDALPARGSEPEPS